MKASAKLECIKYTHRHRTSGAPVGAKIFSEYEMYMMTLKNLFLGSHGQASSRDEMLEPTDEK